MDDQDPKIIRDEAAKAEETAHGVHAAGPRDGDGGGGSADDAGRGMDRVKPARHDDDDAGGEPVANIE